ncbi:MAG: hypothetical protein EON59_09270 [Alphaproteobacteria bacterium]|nr:MAG: hypothetical protein EON59_09270 [Alphaproteobacteria bacterium]
MAVPLKFEIGHTVRLIDVHGREFKYYVRKVSADGWMFEPYDRPGELEFHSGESVFEVYFAGRLRYDGFDPAGITEARRAAMEIAYENHRPERRLRAERRLVFVRAIEKAMRSGDRKGVALVDAPKDVVKWRGDEWRREDQKRLDDAFAGRVAKGLTAPGDCAKIAKLMKVPCERTLWTWIKDYVAAGRSVVGLVPGAVGNHGSHLTADSEAAIQDFIEQHVSADELLRLGAAYKRYFKQEQKEKRTPAGRAAFIRRARAHLGGKRIDALTHGKRGARRLHAVSQAVEEPFWVNQQSEVDHVLFNVNLVDDASGVVLGRPWMSVVRERISGAPKGVHLSFLAPSWPTLSRALAHSVWPKDLSGYPDVTGDWPQHGISDEIITDRGMDMI